MKKSTLAFFTVFALILGTQFASAADPVYTSLFSNKALGGYDTVAYFTVGKPVKGDKQFKHEYKGADWYFSSKENLELFKKSPTNYAPQYGGYCAWAVGAKNSLYKGDAKHWKIIDKKLYLNYNKSVNDDWLKDTKGFIIKADKNWPSLLKR